MSLLDRVSERADLDRMLAEARAGRSGVAVLEGEPGIGKTALLRYGVEAADDFTVAEVTGVESEQEMDYAALHRLLRPFTDARDALPPPQHDALASAFGLVTGPPGDRFLVGLAVLTLLSGLAAERPLLVVCDDAQWLDRASLHALAFVGRRLLAEPVVLLFGAHNGGLPEDVMTGLDRRTVAGLPAEDAVELLAGGGLDQVLRLRLVAEADGNPLLLGEIAQELDRGETTPAHLAGEPLLGRPLPVGRRLEQHYLARLGRLSPYTRTFLLVVAAEATGDAEVVKRAARRVLPAERFDDAVAEAERHGLVAAEPSVWAAERFTFRHSAIRSAVYSAGPGQLRRQVHAALAEVTAEGRLWHRAAAAAGPDEAIAADLERQADMRGGHMSRSAQLALAADLSVARVDRDRRLLAAAAAALDAGATGRTNELLDRIGPCDDDIVQARANRLRGLLGDKDSVPLLLDAAAVLSTVDRPAARDALLAAFDAAVLTAEGVAAVAAAAGTLPPPTGEADVPDLILDGHATLATVGPAQAVPKLCAAVSAMRDADLGLDTVRWSLLGLLGTLELRDEESLGACAAWFSAAARDRGEPRTLRVSLAALAVWELLCGRFAAAEGHLTELHEAIVAAEVQGLNVATALVHAWRGDEEATRTTVRRGLAAGGAPAQVARTAVVVLDLGAGHYPDALAHAQAIDAHWGGFVLGDLVEAATRCGEDDAADRALAALADRAIGSGSPWALGVLARSRALRSDDADALYREALDQLGRTPLATELARTHLLHGEWLRRRRRRTEAVTSLRTAHEMFTVMGAAGFAARAGQELRAAGGSPRVAEAAPASTLTPQEARIAELVVAGATNQEIATTMFLSVSTVEYHLRKVFRKLDITSRRQLRLVLRS
jgi:DNA-binding CsgD family transcriptional regulator